MIFIDAFIISMHHFVLFLNILSQKNLRRYDIIVVRIVLRTFS